MMPEYPCLVGPLYSRVTTDFPYDLRMELARRMAIEIEHAQHVRRHKPGWDGKIKFFSVTGSFYTGLLPVVQEHCKEFDVRLRLLEQQVALTPRCPDLTKKVKLRDYQEQIVTEALRVKRGIIKAAVNSGKTEIALEIIRRLRLRTLYLVPTERLFTQFIKDARARLPGMQRGVIAGTTFDPGLLTIMTVQTAVSRLAKGTQRQPDPRVLKFMQDVECVFIDEGHHGGAKAWSEPLKACRNAPYRFALSATPFGASLSRNYLLQGLTGAMFTEVTTQFLIERGHSTKTLVKFIQYEHEQDDALEYLDDATLYQLMIEENRARADAMYEALDDEFAGKRQICIMVDTHHHGDFLAEVGEARGQHPVLLYGTMKKDEKDRIITAFRRGQIQCLITTLLKEGFNLAEMDVLVNAAGRRSQTNTTQRGGRVLRTRTGKDLAVIYDFIDDGDRRLIERSWHRYNAYKAEGHPSKLLTIRRSVS